MTMISTQQLERLIVVLDDEISSLNVVLNSFHKNFPNKAEHFPVGCALYMLIEDNLLVSPHQKLIAYFILYDIFDDNIRDNPFFPIFIAAMKKDSPQWERPLAAMLINSLTDDILSMNAKDIIERLIDSSKNNVNIDIDELSSNYLDNIQSIDWFQMTGVPNTIYFENQGPSNNYSNDRSSDVFKVNMEPQDFHLNLLEPYITRPPPPLLEPTKDEIMWINPIMIAPKQSDTSRPLWFEWDNGVTVDRKFDIAKKLLEDSREEKLDENSIKLIIEQFENDLGIIDYCELTPKKLMLSLEKNSTLVGEILIKLMDSPYISEYLKEVMDTEISLPLIEAVNLMISTERLPKELVDLFISNCLDSCSKTKNVKTVRIVCLFVMNLIKTKKLELDQMRLIIEQFCAENTTVKEVQILYRLLKQTDQSSH